MVSPETANPLVILNPAANRGHMSFYRSLVRSRAAQEQAEYIETSRPGEAQERALLAAKEGRSIVVVGGDGSVHEVVNGILAAERRVPLGIIAAGSGNDFAWNMLHLPHDPAAAVERAFHGRLIEVDAGAVNDRYFANAFSVGVDANSAAMASRLKKYPFMSGARLYYTASLSQLLFAYHKCPWLTLALDGESSENEAAAERYVLMAVSNGPTYGAGFHINPKADYTDGLLDICTIRYAPLMRALRLLPVVQAGQHEALPEATFYRAKSVHIQCQNTVNVQIDGEIISASSIDARILPAALSIRV